VATSQVVLIAAVVIVPAVALWLIFLGRSRSQRKPRLGIPRALRPGQPDEALEGRRLERIQAWGLVTTLALAIFIPAYWLPERQRQESFTERFADEAVARGRLIFSIAPPIDPEAGALQFKNQEDAIALGQGCAKCHGPSEIPTGGSKADLATGGFADPSFVDPLTGKKIKQYAAPPLQTVFQRWDPEVIQFTIERGRPGTPMPTWGVAFGGSMTDQMVTDVMAWLATLPGNKNPPPDLPGNCQKPEKQDYQICGKAIFEARCAVCHGPEGQGKDQSGSSAVTAWHQGAALWHGKVKHLTEQQHELTVINGRRFAFMPPFGAAPSQGIPVPLYPLNDKQVQAVVAYERKL
jgi:cytochrome c553